MKVFLAFFCSMTLCHFSHAQNVEVDFTLSPAGSFKAQTKKIKGEAYKNGDGFIAENVSVDLGSLDTGISLRNKHMKEKLNVSKFPSAKLVKATGKNGKGEALIDIKGKKMKVKGTYSVDDNMLTGTFPMKLSDLGIKDVRYMGVGVDDELNVTVTLPVKGP